MRLCHGWPGPEVLLSHLLSMDYTQNGGLNLVTGASILAFDQFLWDQAELLASLKQGFVALHGRWVGGGFGDGFFHLRV